MSRPRLSGLALVTLAAGLLSAPVSAELVLPRPSPQATVSQTVGVTDVTVSYSSPAVRGRTVFGDLVPFDTLWRTGANMATTVDFSTDVRVGGKLVPTGTYALFSIPGAREWTLILNKNHKQGGTRGYDQALDQVRVTARPAKIPARERMTFIFSDTTDDRTRLDLEWGEVRVSLPIEVDTAALAKANVDKATAEGWRDYANAARYMLETDGDVDRGLAWADMALAIDDRWYTNFIKAQLLAKKGDFAAAHATAEKAYAQGKKDSYFFWEAQVEAAVKEYAAKK